MVKPLDKSVIAVERNPSVQDVERNILKCVDIQSNLAKTQCGSISLFKDASIGINILRIVKEYSHRVLEL